MADSENIEHLNMSSQKLSLKSIKSSTSMRSDRSMSALDLTMRSPGRKRGSVRTLDVPFQGLPLGIDVESAISQKNLFVKGSNNPKIPIGSQIVKVAGVNVVDMDAPNIVKLIQTSPFPLILSFQFRKKPQRPSMRSPRSTARIEFVDGSNRLIPMNDMTVKQVVDFIWATGEFTGELDHYGMFVIDLQEQTRDMIHSLSSRTVSEEVLDVSDDLASKRYEFRVKDEWESHYMATDVQAFRGPWLTLDNEQVTFDLDQGSADFANGRRCRIVWKGPNVVELEQDVFKKICFINEDQQLSFKTGEIWVPNNSNFLNVQSRVRQVSAAQILLDVHIKQAPIGLEYRVADTGEQVIISKVEPGSDADNAAVQLGDVVTSINNQSYRDVHDMLAALSDLSPPFRLQVSRLRGSSMQNVHRDDISSLPQMNEDINGFLRIYVEGVGVFTCPCHRDTTVADIRKFLRKHKGVQLNPHWPLFVTGTQELRTFKQVLDETNNPLEIRDAITKDGQYAVKFRFAENTGEDDDSDSDSDYSSDLEEAVPDAPTRGGPDAGAWDHDAHEDAMEKIASVQSDMMEQVARLQAANPDVQVDFQSPALQELAARHGEYGEGEYTPMGEALPADPQIVRERIALVEEAVRKQWLIAEALHDFDKESIQNWPDYSTLQSLQQGDMLLVSKRDPTGWWKGKNIMGGDYGESVDGAYFPGSYVEVVAKPLYLAKTMFEFNPDTVPNFPSNMVLLELNTDDILIVTDTHESGWWRGCNLLGGAEGYFPRDFVEITAQPDLMNDQWAQVFPNLKMKGWLDKKARVMRKWRRYYFVFEGHFVKYYDSDTADPRNPLGKIRVIDEGFRSQIVKDMENFKKFTIKAMRKEWELRVEVQDDRDMWCESLTSS